MKKKISYECRSVRAVRFWWQWTRRAVVSRREVLAEQFPERRCGSDCWNYWSPGVI